ncbi:hypothetical protein LOD99_10339 [Oopsacas minuta]|uniref:GRF-type domain-containing protein n=1 Tax=Oopsacas minuta TaxID=111878 RepID=A0AAV7KHP6_9METZ|nr:hypothetical protein LOD99_10339 [Oopsacas minuta]
MAEQDFEYENFKQLHSSQSMSDKKCRCGDPLRRWRVLKDSPNRGRVFLQCQGAWPQDPSGLSAFCLDWHWEDELDPVPDVFSFREEYLLHPDARAYFYSQDYMKRNRIKILDLTGSDVSERGNIGIVRAMVHRGKRYSCHTQTEITLMDGLDEIIDFSLRLTPQESPKASPLSSRSSARYTNRTDSGDEEISVTDYGGDSQTEDQLD